MKSKRRIKTILLRLLEWVRLDRFVKEVDSGWKKRWSMQEIGQKCVAK